MGIKRDLTVEPYDDGITFEGKPVFMRRGLSNVDLSRDSLIIRMKGHNRYTYAFKKLRMSRTTVQIEVNISVFRDQGMIDNEITYIELFSYDLGELSWTDVSAMDDYQRKEFLTPSGLHPDSSIEHDSGHQNIGGDIIEYHPDEPSSDTDSKDNGNAPLTKLLETSEAVSTTTSKTGGPSSGPSPVHNFPYVEYAYDVYDHYNTGELVLPAFDYRIGTWTRDGYFHMEDYTMEVAKDDPVISDYVSKAIDETISNMIESGRWNVDYDTWEDSWDPFEI